TFKSFNVTRKNVSAVGVTWTTASEKDNRGFNVQRNDGTGWKNVAFVFSQTVAGTSSSDLSYEYNDANTEKGVSQYRIQQVDLDGRASFSIIRATRGENAAAKLLVYPNPSSTGNVSVVFDNSIGVRDISISDATGRVIKSFQSITNSVLQVENLRKGFYTIRVTNRTTAASTVEKVVIK
ncbi:MAG TPA: T9SS type A sorting domain-containing protein, partial [Chitinophagaceae bacterium]|nr:T9SS type A sorting domain-containing protein [Chitinophagaceae bacterium]